MSDPADSSVQNLLPVQAYFDTDGNFQTFIGQNKPFYATTNPDQSGLHITDSTIDSTTIGATTPSTGVFTNVSTTTGQVSTSPVNNADIANKQYVDAVAQGLKAKQAVKCATTGNITLSGLQTIDTYTTLAGDRVLVKNQTNTAENGIYIAASGAWTRSSDMDVWSEVPGSYTVALNGSTNLDTGWVCTAAETGTIGVTAMPWVQFSGSATYYAGTGLTLAANTFSITNTGVTAATKGSASKTVTATVNAQGQLTSLTDQDIAIAATQVTSGTLDSARLSGSYTGITGVGTLTAGTWNATPIANAYLANSSLTVNGTSISLGGSGTVKASTTNALTFNNSGTGAASGSTFDGSSPVTVSYNSVGAPSTTGTNASGTWGISISGNADTATTASTATTATTANNLANGAAGSVPYQSGSGTTTYLAAGTSGQVLSTNGASAPTWIGPSAFLNNITTTQGSLIYRNSVGWVNLAPGTAGQVLQTGGAGADPSWLNQSSIAAGSATTATTATTSTNLAGGAAGYVPYQSGSGATSFVSSGTIGQVLTSNGSSAPTWTTPASAITISDDTTTNATRYPLFANQTTGSASTEYVSSTKFQFNPSTGTLTASVFSGAGTSLTGTASGLSIGGNAATATSATTATNLAGGASGSVPYQTGSGATTMLAAGTNGQILTLAGGVPTWAAAPATGITITDDTTTNSDRYLTFTSATTGSITGENVSSTKLKYNPSTGVLNASAFVASAGLYSTSTYTATYTDGIVADYTTGNGRISVGSSDTLTFYNGGVANTQLAQLDTKGNLQISGGIFVNSKTIAANYSIPSGSSGHSAGPITISSGVSVTVASGSKWVIL